MIFFAIIFVTSNLIAGEDALLTDTYRRLDAVRERKQTELVAYLQRMQKLADSITSDRSMSEFFRVKYEYFKASKGGDAPAELKRMIETAKRGVRDRYLHNYMAFYDILFIAKDGDIFYTIRQEKDYRQNIFQGDMGKTALARELKSGGQKTLVDYQYYVASDEPCAFFVEPVLEKQELLGWFALQCTMNKINSMFSLDVELGNTGEVILVNRQQYMLTDSRFFGDSSILKRHLSPKNIEEKFREGKGHRIVTDYRGVRAVTSFAVCPVGETQWLLIAKIDEDEVITEEYRRRNAGLSTALLRYFQETGNEGKECTPYQDSFVRVDMDEFRKGGPRDVLGTFGVSTCTAAIVCYPNKFAYMAHMSTFDKIYGLKGTDLIGHIMKRIRHFDIPKSELRNLQITLAAPHLNSIVAATNLLVEEGFLLSQIRFLYLKDAEYGSVYHVGDGCRVVVQWKVNRNGATSTVVEDSTKTRNMGEIIKKLIISREL